jgi:hypothetical protein
LENRNMLRGNRHRIATLSLGVLGLLCLTASHFRANESAVNARTRTATPAPKLAASMPEHLGVSATYPRRHYIVQAQSADAARDAVFKAGGVVNSDLSVIRALRS